MASYSESYKDSGVDITAGYRAVELMKPHIKRTPQKGVLGGIGGFGGMFEPDLSGYERPVLVSSTDSVGTKLKLAFITGKHDTVGIDAVAMCVNDIICCGAEPLLFLDYVAMGKLVPETAADLVKGVADGCIKAGCSLVGGETAELPGIYADGEYDLVGFTVGAVDKKNILDPANVRPGDAIIGLGSSGFHSNGFSLVRKIFDVENSDIGEFDNKLGMSLADALMTPTRIYVKPVMALLKSSAMVKGISNITGGGFYENIPRCLPKGLSARIEKGSWEAPPVFGLLRQKSDIPERDLYNTFNMGIGMVIVVAKERAEQAADILNGNGEKAAVIGEIAESDEGVILW